MLSGIVSWGISPCSSDVSSGEPLLHCSGSLFVEGFAGDPPTHDSRIKLRLGGDVDASLVRRLKVLQLKPPLRPAPSPSRSREPAAADLARQWLVKKALPQDNLRMAKQVLDDGAEITAQDEAGNSLLAVAVEHGCSRELLQLLLDFGCPLSSTGSFGQPLQIAARAGDLGVALFLLANGADLSHIHPDSLSPDIRRRLSAWLPIESNLQGGKFDLHKLSSYLASTCLVSLCRCAARAAAEGHGSSTLIFSAASQCVILASDRIPATLQQQDAPRAAAKTVVDFLVQLVHQMTSPEAAQIAIDTVSAVLQSPSEALFRDVARNGLFHHLGSVADNPRFDEALRDRVPP
eukprot:CAMPEP_0204337718 /NCGR_PEP_ID=MMETSP0469-20131031/20539_1 /ASSEMBLY_ACC=CAM_ASM_000384 /TAXON_ID=2969 /ORGANISM="Oxyrrhis marina" /LENGTH=347 /DNA_ID=CAMNT_0051321797 /DNA_START=273 /DNA_END=1312 /DNA_ORIENTATION=-